MEKELKIEKFNAMNYNQVKKIYNESFPKDERASFYILMLGLIRNCELFVLKEENIVYGFIYLINYKDMTFILYLAIDSLKRSKGYGRYLLNWCKEYKNDKIIYLNIDEINEKFEDYNARNRRLNFYLSNGFYLTEYLSIEQKCNFNIMSSEKDINLKNYIKLDKRIANILFDRKSNIQKNNELRKEI